MGKLLDSDALLRKGRDMIIGDRLISLFPTFPRQRIRLPVVFE
jgi:hypothetical protein